MKFLSSLWDMAWLIAVFIFVMVLPAYAQPVSTPAIPEAKWRYHVLPADVLADVCSTFVDQREHPGIPLACSFKNLITKECHIFVSPGIPGSLFAMDYEKKRCRGEEK